MNRLHIDSKAVLGITASILGWVAVNGAIIIPTLPVEYQHTAGTVVLFAGVALTLFAKPPIAAAPKDEPK